MNKQLKDTKAKAGMQESHWKKSAAGLAAFCDSQTLGALAWSSSHRRCHGATDPSLHKEGDSPPEGVGRSEGGVRRTGDTGARAANTKGIR